MTAAPLWTNRIVGHAEVDPRSLTAHPLNWRAHPANQSAALDAAIDDIGFWRSVNVNQRSGVIVDGHLRVARAIATEQPTIPVEWVDLSPDEERKALATADAIAGRAEVVTARLDALMRQIESARPGLQDFLASFAKEHKIFLDQRPAVEDPGSQLDRAEVLQEKWQTALGQIWLIPSRATPGRVHRVICGDSTHLGTIQRLMGTERAAIIITDPPYGVAIVGRTADALTIENDDLGEIGTRKLLTAAFRIWPLRPGGSFYVFSPAGNTELAFRMALDDTGYPLHQTLVWVKQHFVFSRMDYHWKHESILFGWAPGAGHYFVPDRTLDTLIQDDELDVKGLSKTALVEILTEWHRVLRERATIWREDRPARNLLHPTIKPTPLIVKALRNSSLAGDICFDGFLGSGTTLVGCEQTGRICYAAEIEEKYLAATLERASLIGLAPLQEAA